jgi:hypothetical protein
MNIGNLIDIYDVLKRVKYGKINITSYWIMEILYTLILINYVKKVSKIVLSET